MRNNSFEKSGEDRAYRSGDDCVTAARSDRRDMIGALLVAITAFVAWYQRGNPPSGVNLDSGWYDVLSRGFARGWQWGSDIVFTYGPLGFLTPYVTWNPESAAPFRVGQIVLCLLWAAMAFAFARRLGLVRQALLIFAMLAFYPLLVMDIGWNVPFFLSVVLIYRLVVDTPGLPNRQTWLFVTIVLLSLLALIKFTGQVMWIGVIGYATLLGLLQRDYRIALTFGIGGPIVLLAIWLALGQQIGGIGAYLMTSLEMSTGYGAMSLKPESYVDAIGMLTLALVTGVIAVGYWLVNARRAYLLVAVALMTLSYMVWKAGYVRADNHIGIFFGSVSFISLAVLCIRTERHRKLIVARWLGVAAILVTSLSVTYHTLSFEWSIRGIVPLIGNLLSPQDMAREYADRWYEQIRQADLPRTRARVGLSRVDVLMNEQSTAVLNNFNFKPRPAFQGYGAYTTQLARMNEASLLDPARAPEYLLTKLQSIDFRLPTGEDPLTVLAALRGYLPVDREGGYLVMRRTGWPVAPMKTPDSDRWKVATLGADLALPTGPEPQVLFFDFRLNFWGKLRSVLLREPAIHIELELGDGTRQSYLLVRKLGAAGVLISPFLLSSDDYLQWHAGLKERRVKSMRLIADRSEIGLFEPRISYALAPVELPRLSVDKLSEELQQTLYPGFRPAPILVESGSAEVVNENGKNVLFTHAPAKLTFALAPGEWSASGDFGLLSSAYECLVSDGIALVAERVDASGKATRLFQRAINPVHDRTQRGENPFAFGPFMMGPGDKLLLRNETGLSSDSTGGCDWMFMGPVKFERSAAAVAR